MPNPDLGAAGAAGLGATDLGSGGAADRERAGLSVLSRASFMTPEWFPPTAWVQHAPFVYWLVTTLRPRSYVELGSHFGYSLFAVCQAVKAYGLPTRCVGIDAWQGDEHAGFYRDEVFDIVKARAESRYPGIVELKRMYFDQALGDFADGSIDLLHVDGRHFYEDARHDFETWLPKVAPGGIVMLHDTTVHERGFGVHRLWAELRDKYPSFEFLHGNGLGVLAVGTPPPQVAALFAAARDETALCNVRTAYERLGASLEPAAKSGRQVFKNKLNARLKRQARDALYRLGLAPTPADRLDPAA